MALIPDVRSLLIHYNGGEGYVFRADLIHRLHYIGSEEGEYTK